MIINIVTGGPKVNIPNLCDFTWGNEYWIGADRGTVYLLEAGLKPERAFGDFDSITGDEWNQVLEEVNVTTYPSEKNESDFELALQWSLEQKPEEIRVFGATGGRLDHELSNIQLLLSGLKYNIPLKIIDKQNEMMLLKPGSYVLEEDERYKYVSFISLNEKVIGMSLRGFKYTLENRDVSAGTTLCISNEFVTKKGTISFQDGIVIVIRSKD